jgi:hypothetical protein
MRCVSVLVGGKFEWIRRRNGARARYVEIYHVAAQHREIAPQRFIALRRVIVCEVPRLENGWNDSNGNQSERDTVRSNGRPKYDLTRSNAAEEGAPSGRTSARAEFDDENRRLAGAHAIGLREARQYDDLVTGDVDLAPTHHCDLTSER